MSIIKSLSQLKEPKISELGGKGYSLAILTNNGFNVPKGFVITSTAFFDFLEANGLKERIEKLSTEINEDNFKEKSKEIRNLIISGEIPREIGLEVEDGLKKLNVQYASIRSSAVSEDSIKASFAGLFDTFLNIKTEANLILENIKKCWSSLFNERAVAYRIRKEIPHLEGMTVIVQEMIPAEVSGVTFTVHPSNKESLVIEAAYGIGELIVGGKIDPDEYRIDRKTMKCIEKKIGKKNKISVYRNRKTEIENVKNELVGKQAMSDKTIDEVAQTSLRVEKFFNFPQDIEWSILNNKLWLLQSRAITRK